MKTVDAAPSIFCTFCGNLNPPASRACDVCGVPFRPAVDRAAHEVAVPDAEPETRDSDAAGRIEETH